VDAQRRPLAAHGGTAPGAMVHYCSTILFYICPDGHSKMNLMSIIVVVNCICVIFVCCVFVCVYVQYS